MSTLLMVGGSAGASDVHASRVSFTSLSISYPVVCNSLFPSLQTMKSNKYFLSYTQGILVCSVTDTGMSWTNLSTLKVLII